MQSFEAASLRNVVLLSHSGAGKTSLAEAFLYSTKAVTRLGNVQEGNTASDYEPEEVRRQTSIQTSVLPCVWRDHKLNFLDTPGYADFIGEVLQGLRAADAAVLMVSAPSGLEVGTEQMWDHIRERNLPVILFINKMDRENADFARVMNQIHASFGNHCVAINEPIGAEGSFEGAIDLFGPEDAVPEGIAGHVRTAKDRLVEAIAEANDDLATKYLEGEKLTPDELVKGLRAGVETGDLVPVIAGSATQNLGVETLLDAILHYLPNPSTVAPANATSGKEGGSQQLQCDDAGPLAALVFKTTADPFVGKLSYFRVYSGTLRANSEVWNSKRGQPERIGQVFVPRGKAQDQVDELRAGDIGAVSKLTTTATGDTLTQRENPLALDGIAFPSPSYGVAVHPKGKADLDKMSVALARLAEEDPSLRVTQEIDTGELVVTGIGDTHVEVVAEKAKRKFGAELELTVPKIAYKETIGALTKVEYKHKKQTGGHGQYGHVMLELEPQPKGTGFEFAQRVTGGNVPREYFPAVEKGVVKALQDGAVAGFPIVDIKVTLYDGSFHPVDSSGMSFEIAGGYALRKGVAEGSPMIMEPVMKLHVQVPDACTGEVIGDLNSKRGRILGMIPEGGSTVIDAEVPQSEVLRYATDLRSISQGRGSFTMEFSSYEAVPDHLAQRIIGEAAK